MLLTSKNDKSTKPVIFLTRSPQVCHLLSEIVAAWGFHPVTDPQHAEVLFIERGLPEPVHCGRVVWLTPMPLAERSYLETPISLTRLYSLLEEKFFISPRRHIRASVKIPSDIQVAGAWQSVLVISLSARGCRMVCDSDIPRGTVLKLDTSLAGRPLRLDAEALYCIPAGDTEGWEKPQVGLLFKPLEAKVCSELKSYIEQCCVTRVCSSLAIAQNDPVLSWFDLSRDP